METTKTKTMEKSNNYKLTFSNFYYKSNGKHIDDGQLSESGNECGISLKNFNDIKQGDRIEVFTKEKPKKV